MSNVKVEAVNAAFTLGDPATSDPVNHPAHYNSHPSGIECIEIVRHHNFNTGNAIKYVWRHGLKDQAYPSPVPKVIEDLEKARWYLADEIRRLGGAPR